MSVIQLDDLAVIFPYKTAYTIQKDLMAQVVNCIKTKRNGLIESPTGTGKTVSLLCSALAWHVNQKIMQLRGIPTDMEEFGSPDYLYASSDMSYMETKVPKIVYATRTHAQIAQCVKELQKTDYSNVSTLVLGSRDMLCLNKDLDGVCGVAKIKGCQRLLKQKKCEFFSNLQNSLRIKSSGEDIPVIGYDSTHPIMDIEELRKTGNANKHCPFFMSKELVDEAELLFLPYNYLLDPKLPTEQSANIRGNIIILDESHNVPQFCEESSSFELHTTGLKKCVQELDVVCTTVRTRIKHASVHKSGGVSLEEMEAILKAVKALTENLSSDCFPELFGSTGGGTFLEVKHVLDRFSASGFTVDNLGCWIHILENASKLLVEDYMDSHGCESLAGILRILQTRLLREQPDTFAESYVVKVVPKLEQEQSTSSKSKSQNQKSSDLIIKFWCFNAAVTMDLLLQHKPRCIIFASGTLFPSAAFEQELGQTFPIKLQNRHFVEQDQLYCAMVKVGPDGVKLSSDYKNRSQPAYLKSLRLVIQQSCQVVPEGVLVFFASYSALDCAVKFWKEHSLWEGLCAGKSMYIEERGRTCEDTLVRSYYRDCARGKGSVLFGVCRGKLSEGLDFSNEKCRCVIVTGVPFAPIRDEVVAAKMDYLNKKKSKTGAGLGGNYWYNLDAARALNQAVGRIIRNNNDYGVVLLCDEKCDFGRVKNNLSTWLMAHLAKNINTFKDVLHPIKEFFEKKGTTVNVEVTSEPESAAARSSTTTDKTHQQKSVNKENSNSSEISGNSLRGSLDIGFKFPTVNYTKSPRAAPKRTIRVLGSKDVFNPEYYKVQKTESPVAGSSKPNPENSATISTNYSQDPIFRRYRNIANDDGGDKENLEAKPKAVGKTSKMNPLDFYNKNCQ